MNSTKDIKTDEVAVKKEGGKMTRNTKPPYENKTTINKNKEILLAEQESSAIIPAEFECDSNNSCLRLTTGNERLEIAKGLPEMKRLFGSLWHYGELTLFAGDNGLGKTILAIGLGIRIGRGDKQYLGKQIEYGDKIIYADFELFDKGFEKRYKDFEFPDSLYFCNYDPNSYSDLDADIITELEVKIKEVGAKILIVDNISAIFEGNMLESRDAIKFMRRLHMLRKKSGLSILVIAHINKISPGTPLHKNQITGSKAMQNLIDSAFMIGETKLGNDVRYIKQVKTRYEPETNKCLIIAIKKERILDFEYIGEDDEQNIIPKFNKTDTRTDAVVNYLRNTREAKSNDLQRVIKEKCGVGDRTSQRVIQELKEQHIIIENPEKYAHYRLSDKNNVSAASPTLPTSSTQAHIPKNGEVCEPYLNKQNIFQTTNEGE